MRRSALLFALAVILPACGGADPDVDAGADGQSPADSSTTVTEPADGDATQYRAVTTVLESSEHGPQLCLGGVADSLPPQCGGPDVVGWDWDLVDDEQSVSGTTWGDYTVVGTWDGEQLTLTQDPMAPEWTEPEPINFSTPCEEPADGWPADDPIDPEAMDAALSAARTEPDFAGAWVDESISPTMLNLRFTGDLEAHEAELRELWGGPLCLIEADTPLSELMAIQEELFGELDGALSAGVDEVNGTVHLTVILAEPGLQADLDARYGAGTVEVTSALQPVE